jgi:hypothetical protein
MIPLLRGATTAILVIVVLAWIAASAGHTPNASPTVQQTYEARRAQERASWSEEETARERATRRSEARIMPRLERDLRAISDYGKGH